MKTLTLCILISAQFLFAGFKEGLIEYKITNPQGSGNLVLKISPKASRAIITMSQVQLQVTLDFLIKLDSLNKVIQIDEASKSYSIMELKDFQNSETSDKEKALKVKKLGKGKILGYTVNHILVEGTENRYEMWVTKEIEIYSMLKKLQAANSGYSNQLQAFEALEKKGLEGFPLKTVQNESGLQMTMEAVKIEKKKFPAATFQIPADYKETQGMNTAIIRQLTGEQNTEVLQKIFQENMTPEKMEQLKKMMEKAMENAPK